jgi:hypothetical protein
MTLGLSHRASYIHLWENLQKKATIKSYFEKSAQKKENQRFLKQLLSIDW